ncbi:MAG: iron ABC transporter permease [Gaiellales bacterium]|nr:iron ABC transporter permease [Gaiellales bacterium]
MRNLSAAQRFRLTVVVLLAVLLVAFVTSFLIGRYSISVSMVIDILLSKVATVEQYWEETLGVVVLDVRLPRIVLAILVGGALSASGASYQTLFKNPLVSPDILGVSAGAGFGAALAMINNANWVVIQGSAFLFGLVAVIMAYAIANLFGGKSITVLILGGIVVSSLFQAMLSIIKTLADTENQLPSITFWLMGSLGRGVNRDVLVMLPALAVSMLMLVLFRHHINALAAGEDEARTMGVNVTLVKAVIVTASTLMTVCAVSIAGIVGWVGLVIPHLARMLSGAHYSRILIVSFLLGGLFLLCVDNIIRGVPDVEVPLGVLTAIIGTPIFAVLLPRLRQGWT